jgi:hypothetical protein
MMKKQFSALNFNGPFGDVTHCQDQLTELCHHVTEKHSSNAQNIILVHSSLIPFP